MPVDQHIVAFAENANGLSPLRTSAASAWWVAGRPSRG
jgi:hypothetical protein